MSGIRVSEGATHAHLFANSLTFCFHDSNTYLHSWFESAGVLELVPVARTTHDRCHSTCRAFLCSGRHHQLHLEYNLRTVHDSQ